MTTIGINAIGTRHSGAATVLLAAINEFLQIDHIDQIVVFASPNKERRFAFPSHDRLRIIDAPEVASNLVLRFIWFQRKFRDIVAQAKCDAVFNFNNLAGPLSVPQALFIQQSLYYSQEALRTYRYPAVPYRIQVQMIFQALLLRHLFAVSARYSQAVVVQTETMKTTIGQWIPSCRSKISVVSPKVNITDETSILTNSVPSEILAKDFAQIIYVGNSSPYKNLAVIKLAASLAEENRRPWRFHLIGPQRALFSSPSIFWHSYLSNEALHYIYRHVTALVMPSLTETVGLPMIEAMSYGVPVVAADRPYAHEICGEGGIFFSPHDAKTLFVQLDQVLNDSDFRAATIESQRNHAKRYISSDSTCELWNVLRRLC